MNESERIIWELYESYPEIQVLPDVRGDNNWARYQIKRLHSYVLSESGKKHDSYYEGVFLNDLRKGLIKTYGER